MTASGAKSKAAAADRSFMLASWRERLSRNKGYETESISAKSVVSLVLLEDTDAVAESWGR